MLQQDVFYSENKFKIHFIKEWPHEFKLIVFLLTMKCEFAVLAGFVEVFSTTCGPQHTHRYK